MIGESHQRLGGERFVTGAGTVRGRRARAGHAARGGAALAPRPRPRWPRSTPSAPASCRACAPCSPAADVPADAVIPNRVPAPAGRRALPAARHRPDRGPLRRRAGRAGRRGRSATSRATRRRSSTSSYEPLPVVRVGGRRARARRAAAVHAGTDSNNVADDHRCGWATPTRRWPAPPWWSARRFHYPRQTAAALETRGLVAVPPIRAAASCT